MKHRTNQINDVHWQSSKRSLKAMLVHNGNKYGKYWIAKGKFYCNKISNGKVQSKLQKFNQQHLILKWELWNNMQKPWIKQVLVFSILKNPTLWQAKINREFLIALKFEDLRVRCNWHIFLEFVKTLIMKTLSRTWLTNFTFWAATWVFNTIF